MPTATNGKTRRVQQRALDTQDALLDTAIECFSRQGYDGVSVRSIEEQAGVNRGLVAYHFTDKATLWRHAVDRLFATMRRALRDALDASGGGARRVSWPVPSFVIVPNDPRSTAS